MPLYAAFLRAVNVGGAGKLPMTDLKEMCATIGFQSVRTYIASGNVVFSSALAEQDVRTKLETRLEAYAGKPIGVHIRTKDELVRLLAANPFSEVAGNRHLVLLLDQTPDTAMIAKAKFLEAEVLRAGERALHIHYPEGQGVSRLKIPGTEQGTSRNRNTIEKIIEMLGEG